MIIYVTFCFPTISPESASKTLSRLGKKLQRKIISSQVEWPWHILYTLEVKHH